jgi:neutral ceramidase
MHSLDVGAAAVDITPRDSQYLFGYPHVSRHSTGVHDPLFSSALYVSDRRTAALFIGNDVIFVPRPTVESARRRIYEATGIPPSHIMITATHTHSGPQTVNYLSNADDPLVPGADPGYLRQLEDGIVAAALAACRDARPAQLGLAVAQVSGVGTNRRDPTGPRDPEVPVLIARTADGIVACMLVYAMHPTVLREDSTLVSADFPGMARRYLQRHVLGDSCPVVYHTGPAGDQSVRYSVQANTFAEAERLGALLGRAVAEAMPRLRVADRAEIAIAQTYVDLPRRTFPPVAEAERLVKAAAERLAALRRAGAPWRDVRRAEIDWFGAEETLTLARAARDGRLEAVYRACLPAEIQVIWLGPWAFVGWPGEVFVEYGLAVKARAAHAFVISLANGELQGYLVTEAAGREGGYEASNAIFAPGSGQVLVDATLALLRARSDTPSV